MPKTKKVESESELSESASGSDSDSSGPQDRNPPAKKAKTEPASSSTKPGGGGSKSSAPKKDNQETSWMLDKKRQIRINEFRGSVFVDIREFYEDKSGDLKPGKKGISLNLAQWRKLKDYISEIDEALKRT